MTTFRKKKREQKNRLDSWQEQNRRKKKEREIELFSEVPTLRYQHLDRVVSASRQTRAKMTMVAVRMVKASVLSPYFYGWYSFSCKMTLVSLKLYRTDVCTRWLNFHSRGRCYFPSTETERSISNAKSYRNSGISNAPLPNSHGHRGTDRPNAWHARKEPNNDEASPGSSGI